MQQYTHAQRLAFFPSSRTTVLSACKVRSAKLALNFMARGKPVRSIKILVPRHNAQKIGAKLSGEVAVQARAQDVRADTYQPNSESAAALNQAIVCLSIRQLLRSHVQQ